MDTNNNPDLKKRFNNAVEALQIVLDSFGRPVTYDNFFRVYLSNEDLDDLYRILGKLSRERTWMLIDSNKED